MKPAFLRQQAAQRLCWERVHMATRCGLRATQPTLMRIDLGLGRWLVHRGLFDDRITNPRLLLGTARDEALPRFWRSVCLEHTALPLARLSTRLEQQNPQALQAVAAAHRSAQPRLAAMAPSLLMREADA